MRDSELAASIVDGEPGALAEAYRKYGDQLWAYCRSLLHEEENAAEAVADTFVIAASKLEVLPVPGRFRAWLYAVARIECRRRIRSTRAKTDPVDGEELRRTVKQLSTGELRQLHALLSAAFAGLDDAERDVMQLVWHGLDLAEVAAVLGVQRANANALFSRARNQLEVSVGVLLMGWSWRGGCDTFEDMLADRNSNLTPALRARLSRHIGRCGVCKERYREQLRPTLLSFLSTQVLLSEASDARSEISPAPVGLWEQVYQMTSQENPQTRWNKILGRRISFGPDGFPRQVLNTSGFMGAPVKVAAVGTVALAATATAWITHGHSTAPTTGDAVAAPRSAAVSPLAASTGTHAGAPSDKIVSTHQPTHAKPSATVKVPASAASSAASSPATAAGSAARSTPTGSATSATPTKSAGTPAAGSPASSDPASTPSPTSSPSAGSTPGTGDGSGTGTGTGGTGDGGSGTGGSGGGGWGGGGSDSSPSAPAEGTLSVSRHTITLAVGSSSSFTLTANDGPVDWSISVPSGLLGSVSVSQQSGSLDAGESVTITVTATGLASVGSQLTISPGDETVTVGISLL